MADHETAPFHMWKILRATPGFGEMIEVAGRASRKTEWDWRLPRLTGEYPSIGSRILAVGDTFDALSAKRPYRDSLPMDRVFEIMRKERPHALDGCARRLWNNPALTQTKTSLI